MMYNDYYNLVKDNDELTLKLAEDMAFCARMPIAFGYEPNVPDKITTSPTP